MDESVASGLLAREAVTLLTSRVQASPKVSVSEVGEYRGDTSVDGLLGDTEFGEDRVDVFLDGGRRDVERCFDAGVGATLGHLAEHVELPGERGERRAGTAALSCHESVDHHGVDDGAAGGDLAQRPDEFLHVVEPVLEHVDRAGGASVPGPLDPTSTVG